MQDDEDVVLVADIGGTNCRFVLWRLDSETGNHEFLFQKVSMLAGGCTCTQEGLRAPSGHGPHVKRPNCSGLPSLVSSLVAACRFTPPRTTASLMMHWMSWPRRTSSRRTPLGQLPLPAQAPSLTTAV